MVKRGLQYTLHCDKILLSGLHQIIFRQSILYFNCLVSSKYCFYYLIILLPLLDLTYKLFFRSSSRVEVLHLNGGRGHSEIEVFAGSNILYRYWFIVNVTGRHCFVLVEIEWTRDRFCLRVVPLALGLSLLVPAHCSIPSPCSLARPSTVCALYLGLGSSRALALVPFLLHCVSCHDCWCSQLLWVVFLHVFHQIRLLRRGEDRYRENNDYMV